MKIYDISQELFGCVVFPGDPVPELQAISRMKDGALYNLTSLSLCAHNGTHVDAPFHFIADGKTVDELCLTSLIGSAFVAELEGEVTAADAQNILACAQAADAEAAKRILIKGKAVVTLDAAQVFAQAGILLLGNESQTVGPEDGPMAVHQLLLGKEVVLLEGIRLAEVPEGVYLLNAAPINLGGCDGAPCRAVLLEMP
ncbi:MAG: cyclase [Ruminococcaceae bacterium]|nr:cyclase [Oscillospiraceae bacterium]